MSSRVSLAREKGQERGVEKRTGVPENDVDVPGRINVKGLVVKDCFEAEDCVVVLLNL